MKQKFFILPVAGAYYYQEEGNFQLSGENDPVMFVAEPENKFDPNAILILNRYYGVDRTIKLGYVPKPAIEAVNQLRNENRLISAVISSVRLKGYRINIALTYRPTAMEIAIGDAYGGASHDDDYSER